MNKKTKNIISVLLLILIFVLMYFTMNYISSNTNEVENKMGNPPNMNGEISSPPEMPDNSSSDTNPMIQNDSNENSNYEEPPEKPDGMNEPNSQGIMENENGMTQPDMQNSNNSIDTIYYVIFAAEGLIAGGIILYLIMSNLNTKSFRETFSASDKKIIYILGTIIVAGCFTILDVSITNNYFLNTNTNMSIPNNMNQTSAEYSSVKEITTSEDISSLELSSTNEDENVISISGNVTSNLTDITVNKTGDSDGGDNTSFYGTNSAIIAKSGANINIENANIYTNATGANGVFSYGGSATTTNTSSDGTTVNISNSKIVTTKDNSGGIMTTGGGTMNASNLEITTSGISSAAIRSDRGGGVVNVDGGVYTTNNQGSPAIYSTANITVKNAKLISNASEGVVIEGKNSVTLENVELTDTNNKLNGQSTTYKNIFLYQSMSGDADNGTSVFTSKNSNIITNKGDTLYVTNTSATINLENNIITNNDSDGNFLRIQKDSWGNNGSNGGNVTLNLTNQIVSGNIVVDSISTLNININDSSSYIGNLNSDNTAKEINLSIDSSSTITLTSNAYVTSFSNENNTNSNINFNGYKLYVNGNSIN